MFADIARAVFAVTALALLALAAVLLGRGSPGFVGPMIWGGLLLVGVVFERWRYKRIQTDAGAGFEPTPERFVDPASGQAVQVWVDPVTKARKYVRDGGR